MNCTVRSLNVLKNLTDSAEAVNRLKDQCQTLQSVLQQNLTSINLCEQIVFIMMTVAKVSHHFRVQCIQNGLLPLLLDLIRRPNSNHTLVTYTYTTFIELSQEVLFENNANRLKIIEHALHFVEGSVQSSEISLIILTLQVVRAIACTSRGSIQFFVKKQGLIHLTSLLETFGNNAEVFCPCCEVIAMICANYTASREVLAVDLIPRIVNVLNNNPYEVLRTFKPCLRALRTISNLSFDCVRELISTSLVPYLLQSVNSTDREIVQESMGILYRISLVDDGCQQLEQEDAETVLSSQLTIEFSAEDQVIIHRDLLIQNIQEYTKKRSKSTHWSTTVSEAKQSEFSPIGVDPRLLTVLGGMLHVNGMSESEILIHLKQLTTLCDDSM